MNHSTTKNSCEPIVPPIYETSLFYYHTFQDMITALRDQQHHYVYSRGKNPTVEIVEEQIAKLEGGEACLCFGSGMGAISAAVLACLKSGDHVLAVGNIYGPTIKLLQYLDKFGITFSVIHSMDVGTIRSSILPNTKAIYLESPTTMNFQLVDLPEVAKLAKQKGIHTIVDNSWATPLFQKPLQMGIDMVVHSASKYLGGHSDLVAGALITSNKWMERIFVGEYQLLGGVLPPFEAWLLHRGLKTLSIRMDAHQKQALQITRYLEDHPDVNKVNYPALESSPDYELGKRMLSGYSGLLSFELKNSSFAAVEKFINTLQLFKIGVSWGGCESLVLSPNFGDNLDDLKTQHIHPGLIRISIGLEPVEDQIEDLEKAFRLSARLIGI